MDSERHRVTPDLQLETLFRLDREGRIRSTREPGGTSGPLFVLIRGTTHNAFAVHRDVAAAVAREVGALAREEAPALEAGANPIHRDRYLNLLAGEHVNFGPAFHFPDAIPVPAAPSDPVLPVTDETMLGCHFSGWRVGEIAAGRAPVMGMWEDGFPVSVAFCARRSSRAAEAGVETARTYQGRGYGPRVTATWAEAVRASGKIPLYSTSWSNIASLAVAKKLGLIPYASDWSIYRQA